MVFWRRPSPASVEAINALDAPWRDGRPAVHDLIAQAIAAGRSIDDDLRDAFPPENPNAIQYVAGAFDSLFGRRGAGEKQADARTIATAITKVLRAPSKADAAHLFALLSDGRTLHVIDEVMPRVLGDLGDRHETLAALARRVVRESPNIELNGRTVRLRNMARSMRCAIGTERRGRTMRRPPLSLPRGGSRTRRFGSDFVRCSLGRYATREVEALVEFTHPSTTSLAALVAVPLPRFRLH